MTLHRCTDPVDKGGFVYTYIGHFECFANVSLCKPHACTRPHSHICVYVNVVASGAMTMIIVSPLVK